MDALRAAVDLVPERPGPVALVEVLDRDGQPRQSLSVGAWPLRIGRAFDNDLVLGDPHVAAHHLAIEPTGSTLVLTVADTRNGVQLGRRRLRGGESAVLAGDGEPVELNLGRTTLRLRLPGQALAPEQALAPGTTFARHTLPLLLAAIALLLATVFESYLVTDPEALPRAAGNALLTALLTAAAWCGVWALLSKTFTRQARFGWHLRVFLIASLALLVVNNLPPLLAFAFSWPVLSAFDFVGTLLVAAAAFYFHLLAVEPARHRVLKWAAAVCAVVAVALTMVFNLQRSDRLGDELYMTHLFPPGLRLARAVPADALVRSLAPLQATLEQKAREPARGDDAGRGDEE